MAVDDGEHDETGIGTDIVRSLPQRPLTAEEWDVIEDMGGLNAIPVGFFVHNGNVTHFVIQFSGSSRIIGWNPLRSMWELIALIDPREEAGEKQVKTIEATDRDGTPVVEFDLGDDFSESVLDFVDQYARYTFQNQVEPTLPSEIDAAADRQELIDAAEDSS